jgi:putative hydrolase of the HAD superfamily
MRTPDAIFFDMDGTILDWQTGRGESWLAACEAGCGRLDGITPRALVAAIQEKQDWFWAHPVHRNSGRMDLDLAARTIVTEAVRSLGVDAAAVAAEIAADYRLRRDACIAPYPGALETLAHFRARGLRMALITNGSARSQRRSVERFGLPQYFDCVVIEGEFGCGKPDERVFRHALESCGAGAARAWMVGDSIEADIATPVALGMHAVWVDAEGIGLADGATPRPHRVVRAISELMA